MIAFDAFPATEPEPADRTLLPVPAGAFTWLAVGNLRPAKDYPTLLAAAQMCVGATRSFHLFIVGEGPGRPSLERGIRRLDLSAHVTLLGFRSDVPRLLRACDAFVLSSAWEGMPNTVMEAMAAGLPVVSTDAGGVHELLVQGECGWIDPFGTEDAKYPRPPSACLPYPLSLEKDRRSRAVGCHPLHNRSVAVPLSEASRTARQLGWASRQGARSSLMWEVTRPEASQTGLHCEELPGAPTLLGC